MSLLSVFNKLEIKTDKSNKDKGQSQNDFMSTVSLLYELLEGKSSVNVETKEPVSLGLSAYKLNEKIVDKSNQGERNKMLLKGIKSLEAESELIKKIPNSLSGVYSERINEEIELIDNDVLELVNNVLVSESKVELETVFAHLESHGVTL